MAIAMTPVAPVTVIAGPDAQRAINRADARANGAANDSADGASRAVALMRTLFGASDETLRLGSDRE